MNVNRSYDHRIRNEIARTGIVDLYPALRIPESTAYSWIRRGPKRIVGEKTDQKISELRSEVMCLRKKLREQEIRLSFFIKAHKVFGLQLNFKRFPKSEDKERFLELVEKYSSKIQIKHLLEKVEFSQSRFKCWRRKKKECDLADKTDCPKVSVQQLTSDEIKTMQSYVCAANYKHLSMGSLCWLAKREGKIHASYFTWQKYNQLLEWRRPGFSNFPCQEKVGDKANSPNEIWHIDLSQIRLEDGSLYYFQAVVDNYSRFSLAWSLSESYSGGATAGLIRRAKRQISLRMKPEVFSDGGREYVNKQIAALLSSGIIDHTVARIEVHFSNSMIESFFWSLKNRYLKHQRLTSFSSLKKHVSFYVRQHNAFIPKDVLNGATPE